jgi:hypothetical protein
LTFGVLPKITYDPALARRVALITRLEEQRALAQYPTYVALQHLWVANRAGLNGGAKRFCDFNECGSVTVMLTFKTRQCRMQGMTLRKATPQEWEKRLLL